jgi:hypothetical protein
MEASEERPKLLCQCGKPLEIFTAQGLELYCRFSKESTTVPYTINNLEKAVAFVEGRRRRGRGTAGSEDNGRASTLAGRGAVWGRA